MIKEPMDVLTAYPVRKGKKRKQAFADDVEAFFAANGYTMQREKGNFATNLVIGDPEKAKYLITAHYDTCARLPIPNFITPRSLLGFLGYQLLVAFLMLLAPMVIAIPVMKLTDDPFWGSQCWSWGVLALCALMMVGPANPSNANDNTSGVVTVLEIAKSLPEQLRGQVCFVLFDLEEAGLVGSSTYRSKHKKAVKHQLVLNMDCVGDGDELYFFPNKKVRKNAAMRNMLQYCQGKTGEKNLTVLTKGFSIYPSDQAGFPYGVGICALHGQGKWVYMNKIHTPKDRVLDYTNVNLLRSCIISMLSSAAK